MKLLKAFTTSMFLALALQSSAVAEKAENFSFKDVDGATHSLTDYKGKWVIVNYWGTYCPPCLEEIPDLVSFAENHKNDAVVLGLDAGGTSIEDLKAFAEENLIDYVIAPVQQSTLTAFGVLVGIPTSYIISPDGDVVSRVIGVIDLEAVEEFMEQYASRSGTDKISIGGILDI